MCALRQLVLFTSCYAGTSEPKSNHTSLPQPLLCYTAQQQCVSQADFDSVVTQIAAVESELNTWQNATIHILKRFLLDNPGKEICDKHRTLVVVVM